MQLKLSEPQLMLWMYAMILVNIPKKFKIHYKNRVSKEPCFLSILIFFFCLSNTLGQKPSRKYFDIVNSKTLIDTEKDKKVDSLLHSYELNANFQKLAWDTKYYAAYHFRKNNYEKAIEYAIKSTRACQKMVPYDEVFHKICLFNLGLFKTSNTDYKGAIQSYQELIKIGAINDESAEAHTRIAINYMKLGDLYQAIPYHDKAEGLLSKRKMYPALFRNNINASDVYRKLAKKSYTIKGVKTLQKILTYILVWHTYYMLKQTWKPMEMPLLTIKKHLP